MKNGYRQRFVSGGIKKRRGLQITRKTGHIGSSNLAECTIQLASHRIGTGLRPVADSGSRTVSDGGKKTSQSSSVNALAHHANDGLSLEGCCPMDTRWI
ncbi:hypothetical protein CEXT_281711 [Caerostris extrusa]|uniref:Uncharacterized protein n=1 Tax=Caerostris extrusa TaxID=172846 RepID=A0AAV4XNK0_CAEEX|nr:hypothetical protein CEXT_281711 [Caerostris extrusa]